MRDTLSVLADNGATSVQRSKNFMEFIFTDSVARRWFLLIIR